MKKIISISIDETILKNIDESRGIATRSRFIETILTATEYRQQWQQWSCYNRKNQEDTKEKQK